MLDFSNDLQRRIREACPGKHVVQFVYSNYKRPPVKLRPDPDIVFFNVAGNYADARTFPALRENLAGWLSFGNPTVWRPNSLRGLGRDNRYPVNFGRMFFRDISDFKANGVVGVSLDCGSGDYSAAGFMFYMIAKAMTNPDRLDYDTIAEDWCRAGFGKAADEIADYMRELEKHYMQAAEGAMGVGGYMDRFDIGEFEARLDKARKLAEGDPEVLARIDYLAVALECAREAAKVRAAWKTGDWKKLGAARAEYKARIKEIVIAHPDATRPGGCAYMLGRPGPPNSASTLSRTWTTTIPTGKKRSHDDQDCRFQRDEDTSGRGRLPTLDFRDADQCRQCGVHRGRCRDARRRDDHRRHRMVVRHPSGRKTSR